MMQVNSDRKRNAGGTIKNEKFLGNETSMFAKTYYYATSHEQKKTQTKQKSDHGSGACQSREDI